MIRNIDNKVLKLLNIMNKEGFEAYIVGGCVRDMLLGVEPNDWDICTNATPIEIIDCLHKNGISHYAPGIDFGTVNAVLDGESFEITTYRKETGYEDNRHPNKIVFTQRIEEDLCRRDFTINAMAYEHSRNELIDPFGGQVDLKNKILRAVGNPEERFKEDALRIIRALRFAIRLQMNIEENTKSAMLSSLDKLDNLSKERVTQELEKILTSGSVVSKYFLEYSAIIEKIIPEISECIGFKQNNKYHKHDVFEHMVSVVDLCKSNDFIIKLSALLHDIGKPKAYTTDLDGHGHFYGHPEISYEICKEIADKRLVLTREQKEELLALVKYHDFSVRRTNKSLKRAIRTIGEELIEKWFILKQADVDDHINLDVIGRDEYGWHNTSELKLIKDEIIASEQCFSLKNLKTDGNAIMKMLDIKPGKHVGNILSKLLEEVVDEQIENDTDVLLKRAKEIYEKIKLNN